MDIRDEAMQLRNEKHQMIKTGLNAKMENSHDLAVFIHLGLQLHAWLLRKKKINLWN